MIIKNNVLVRVKDSDIHNSRVKIPETVTSIGDDAFFGCTSLRSVMIPEKVTSIGDCAFAYCTSLASITIPESVTSIGEYAFDNCDKLTSVIFGENSKLMSISFSAFWGCSKLTSITIPASVTSIGNFAFGYCRNLTSITFAENSKLTSIGERAFANCEKLKSTPAAYKAFLIGNGEIFARQNFKPYKVGHKSFARGNLEPCQNGLHYCTNIFDIFNYYYRTYGKDFVITICDVSDENIGHDSDSKRCARWIIPQRILTREEVIRIMNGREKNNDIT